MTGRRLGVAFAVGEQDAAEEAEHEGPAGEETILRLMKDDLEAEEVEPST